MAGQTPRARDGRGGHDAVYVTQRGRGWILLAPCVLVCTGCLSSTPKSKPKPKPRVITLSPSRAWLGLDYNSRPGVGGLTDFVRHGIEFDREGNIEPPAGAPATADSRLGRGLRTSLAAGMIPDIEIDPAAGGPRCVLGRACVPVGRREIDAYVRGFVATAQSVLASFPGRRVLFEPMDEPWYVGAPGLPPGRRAAVEYASVLARLLPAIVAAKDQSIPLDDVYVPATGRLEDGTSWLTDLYRAERCLKPGPGTCGPIAGWNVHPYGRPRRRNQGIGSVPGLRARMASGADNIVVSEVGFCAIGAGPNGNCADDTPEVVGTPKQAAAWLGQTLREALPMRRAGWLKALLVWARWSGGWSMQLPDGTLTPQGKVLETFANAYAGA
jgi:hypothetical protein